MPMARSINRNGMFMAIAVVVLAAAAAVAAPLRNVPQTLTQPDGTVLHLFATGDEYYNRLHDANGFTVVRDPATGYLVYAIKVDGRLQPTAFVAGEDDPAARRPEAGPDARPADAALAGRALPGSGGATQVRTMGRRTAPAFSTINNLVVFIASPTRPTRGASPADTYQAWFDSGLVDGERTSLEASYGQLTASSTFYPAPSGTTVVSFQDAHNRSYYKPYNATSNPDGYQDNERNAASGRCCRRRSNAIASQVPASLNLDTNRDGYIDSVVFVVSGCGGQRRLEQPAVAPPLADRRRALPGAAINGKQLGDYNLQLDGNVEVGVLCHEMTHTLGAPDLYHYSNCTNPNTLVPVGRWDLMAEDKDPPQHTTAYLKWRYLGFIPTIPAITQTGDYTLNPLTSASDNCYKIASPNSTSEYFVIEYRKPKVFDTTRAGLGAARLPDRHGGRRARGPVRPAGRGLRLPPRRNVDGRRRHQPRQLLRQRHGQPDGDRRLHRPAALPHQRTPGRALDLEHRNGRRHHLVPRRDATGVRPRGVQPRVARQRRQPRRDDLGAP